VIRSYPIMRCRGCGKTFLLWNDGQRRDICSDKCSASTADRYPGESFTAYVTRMHNADRQRKIHEHAAGLTSRFNSTVGKQ
jgi:hypothetical protein